MQCLLWIPHLNDLQHFHACDLAISVQVVHVEGPVEFLLKTSPGSDGQRADELPEVNGTITVFIKRTKGMLGEFWSVAIRKELKDTKHIQHLSFKYTF